jgi:tetratricopeptide (TPR) repeat protein
MDSMAGDHDSARRRCEEAIRLATEVGDRLNVGLAQNNLGDALRDLGLLDEAGRAYASAVETYRDLNDLGPLMAMLEDVAILAGMRGDHEVAFRLVGASDALRTAIGAPRSAAGEEQLTDRLAPSSSALSEGKAEAARRQGSELDVETAIDLTIEAARGR